MERCGRELGREHSCWAGADWICLAELNGLDLLVFSCFKSRGCVVYVYICIYRMYKHL